MAKVLSTNIGKPIDIFWNDKTINTSMQRLPTNELEVYKQQIIGDSFNNFKHHGTDDSRVYAFGIDSMHSYYKTLGVLTDLPYGTLGENLTMDKLDETEISVGDIFQVGSTVLQATYPRIPCVKLNFKLQNTNAQKAMFECGRSGVYFRVLTEGKIKPGDQLIKVSASPYPFLISEVYLKVYQNTWTPVDLFRIENNGSFPQTQIERIKTKIKC